MTDQELHALAEEWAQPDLKGPWTPERRALATYALRLEARLKKLENLPRYWLGGIDHYRADGPCGDRPLDYYETDGTGLYVKDADIKDALAQEAK